MEITITGRRGSLTTYTITGDTAAAQAIVESISTRSVQVDGNECRGEANTAEIRRLVEAVERASAPAQTRTGGRRYIELLDVAERDGLNHGRAWICDGFRIDRDSLPPEWEGRAICYVYTGE